MPRFGVLIHDSPQGLHYDLLLESGETLRTWALPQPPEPGCTMPCRSLPDHRPVYLDYEGPISGGRGSVTRWDSGQFTAATWSLDEIVVAVQGGKLRGQIEIRRTSSDAWQFIMRAG